MANKIFRFIALLLGLWLIWDWLSHLVAEILWFQSVNYLTAFIKRLQTQLELWVVVCSISAGFLFGNLWLAQCLKTKDLVGKSFSSQLPSISNNQLPLGRRRATQTTNNNVNLRWSRSELPLASLLTLVYVIILLIGVMLLHYGKIVFSLWHSNLLLSTITPSLPPPFSWTSVQQLLLLQSGKELFLHLGVLLGVTVALTVNPWLWLRAISFLFSLFFGLIISGQWSRILQFSAATSFNSIDPLFKRDISFYIFNFPVLQLGEFWLGGLFLFCLVAVTLTYLVAENSISEGKFRGFSQSQLRHLYGLCGTCSAVIALHYWLHRYKLLYLTNGIIYGAGYTDINVQLPVDIALTILAGLITFFLLWRAIIWSKHLRMPLKELAFSLLFIVIADFSLPRAVQSLIVQPNELARERPYLQRSIAFTRAAFNLNNVEIKTFDPQAKLDLAALQDNNLTIRNIRLWDTRPLLQSNRQLQQIRLYYSFPDADIDRYTLKAEQEISKQLITKKTTITNKTQEQQQVIIAARELDYNAVPPQAKTWINKHLVYTHGYGFTLSPVNKVAPGGLPDYFVKDIGFSSRAGENRALQTSSESIRVSIPIGTPRIYYGELTNNYVLTSTNVKEFDYPSGNDNAYNIYDGAGGVAINSWWRRGIFAQALKDWRMMFTNNFTPTTRLLFHRNINERIRAIAPFLRYDNDPYLVVANGTKAGEQTQQNFLYWMVDAYTTSDRYPYSDPGKHEFNYIRNSVKVVIDAYNGDVSFYVADPQEPILSTWSSIFPGMFKPLEAMPAGLSRHIRYPEDLFGVQSERLLTYHMTDPQVFYNREDQWEIPNEIYGNKAQSVEPYYLIMKLPTEQSEEFILLHPFTPTKRNNLIAWLAARSDGKNYGKLLLYRFPKQELVYGPEQIEARINQDPVISQQISLWNREGSRAIQGNLLVVPIDRSLLYVEPLYLEAERNSLPTLVRVIVAYENQIVMAENLEQALQAIFKPDQKNTQPIVRPVQ